MIIEIALGIVLAVLILKFWPVFLALGVFAIVIGLAIAALAVVVAVAFGIVSADTQGAMGVAIVVVPIIAVVIFLNRRDAKALSRSRKEKGYE